MAGRTPNLPAILLSESAPRALSGQRKNMEHFHISYYMAGTARKWLCNMEYRILNMRCEPRLRLRIFAATFSERRLNVNRARGTDPARILLYFETIIAEQTG
jgi:hypothetical protein